MPAWTVKSHGKDAINTVLKGLQGASTRFVVSPYADPTIDPINGVVVASFIIPGMQNPTATLYIEQFGDYVSMRLEGINPNVVSDTRKTAKRVGEVPATANAVTRWLQQAAKEFAKQVPKLRRESMSQYPNAEKRIDEQLAGAPIKSKTRLSEASGEYQITFYDRVGEHGTDGRTYNDFKTAVKAAEKARKDTDINDDETYYIGVEGFGGAKEFAVVKAMPEYLGIMAKGAFNDPKDYATFTQAFKKAASSGKTVISKYSMGESKTRLSEASYYQTVYYQRVGQHGNLWTRTGFKTALKDAEEMIADPERNDDETYYIGVEGDGVEFAIVKMTSWYLNYMKSLGSEDMGDVNTKIYLSAAKKALSSGKTVIGKYEE